MSRLLPNVADSAILLVVLSAVFSNKGFPQTPIERAATLTHDHHPAEAAEILRGYLATHPDDVEALISLARIRIDDGDTNAAVPLLQRALGGNPDSRAANIAYGEILIRQRHYQEAMERFETLLTANQQDADARKDELAAAIALALEARAAGHPEAALASLRQARISLPNDPTLLTDLGIQAQQMHLLPEAAEALKTALSLDPDRLDTIYALARVETDQDHLPEAERHLRAYLAARPGDASAHFGLGHVLERQQQHDAAATEFRRSIELQPAQTESYYQLGQIALDDRQNTSARQFFEKTLAGNPSHGGALTGLGIIAYRAKDYQTAQRQLAAATEASPDYQPAHYYLGLTLARLGDKPASDRELQTAVDLARKQQGKGEPLSTNGKR